MPPQAKVEPTIQTKPIREGMKPNYKRCNYLQIKKQFQNPDALFATEAIYRYAVILTKHLKNAVKFDSRKSCVLFVAQLNIAPEIVNRLIYASIAEEDMPEYCVADETTNPFPEGKLSIHRIPILGQLKQPVTFCLH